MGQESTVADRCGAGRDVSSGAANLAGGIGVRFWILSDAPTYSRWHTHRC
jgi:hypothetical protein